MAARPHADPSLPVASPCVALNTSAVRPHYCGYTGVITTDHEISPSDIGIYSHNVEHMGEKRNAYETFILKSEEETPHGQLWHS
jgi:hypothetical protein